MTPRPSGFALEWAWAADLRYLLFDFDGPICGLFAGHDTGWMADMLRDRLRGHGADLKGLEHESNAHTILRQTRGLTGEALEDAVKWLTEREREAAMTAQLTPGVRELIEGLTIPMAVASNNAVEPIAVCLEREGLLARFAGGIHGRVQDEPWLMKPHPNCIDRALEALGARDRSQVALIGDSKADALAAREAGIAFIGFVAASKGQAKAADMTQLGARAVVTHMAVLTRAFVNGHDCVADM
jgi:beta-phosphoglucomutase-like phosphatase (HAD superfamily)